MEDVNARATRNYVKWDKEENNREKERKENIISNKYLFFLI